MPGPLGHRQTSPNPSPCQARTRTLGDHLAVESLGLRRPKINTQVFIIGNAAQTGKIPAGHWWDWAERRIDRLFDKEEPPGLSAEFIRKVQPVFDQLKLNVDLSRVIVRIGGPVNLTRGYDVTLMTQTSPFDKVLGDLLHELGHVVQFVNLPQTEWGPRTEYTDEYGETRYRNELQARYECIQDENAANIEYALKIRRDDGSRYEQDPYLRAMSLDVLASMHLLGRFTLDAQCNRFRDLLLSLPAEPKR